MSLSSSSSLSIGRLVLSADTRLALSAPLVLVVLVVVGLLVVVLSGGIELTLLAGIDDRHDAVSPWALHRIRQVYFSPTFLTSITRSSCATLRYPTCTQ